MKEKAPPRLNSLQWFVSIAAGLAMFLLPQDALNYFAGGYRQAYVGLIAAAIAIVLLLLFKMFEPLGVALVSAMTLTMASFLFRIIQRAMDASATFTMALNVYDGFCWGLVWLIPFLCGLVFRIFAANQWDTAASRKDFCMFFNKAAAAFILYYLIILFAVFLFMRPLNMNGLRQINLIPSTQFWDAVSKGNDAGVKMFAGDFLLFMPVGYFLFAMKPAWRLWQKGLCALLIALTIELAQYLLNTGVADVDDILVCMAGFAVGGLAKLCLDRIRRAITHSEEPKIQYVLKQSE